MVLLMGLIAIAISLFFGLFLGLSGLRSILRTFLRNDVKGYFENFPSRKDLFAAFLIWGERKPGEKVKNADWVNAYKRANEIAKLTKEIRK